MFLLETFAPQKPSHPGKDYQVSCRHHHHVCSGEIVWLWIHPTLLQRAFPREF